MGELSTLLTTQYLLLPIHSYLPPPTCQELMELKLASMDDEQYAYFFNYAESYDAEVRLLAVLLFLS